MPFATALYWTLNLQQRKGLPRSPFFLLLFAAIIRYNSKKA